MTSPAPHLHHGLDANGYPAEVRVVDGQEICVHEHDLPASDVTTVGGIRVTTALRTVIDIAPELTSVDLERVVRDALRRRMFTVDEALARADQPDIRDRPGARRLRDLLLERHRWRRAVATFARQDLVALPLDRAPHRPLLARCWELRANLTPYDAAYVALAELLDVDLVTADARLARASGVWCRIEVVSVDEPVWAPPYGGTVIVAFSISPSGADETGGVSAAVAEAVRIVRESGLPNETNAMFTNLEGEWDEVMAVVKRCVDALAARSPRVSLVLKADIRPGHTGQLTAKVARVEERLRASD